MTEIKRSRPKRYVPRTGYSIAWALDRLNDEEPHGSPDLYQDALETVHAHIARLESERDAALAQADSRYTLGVGDGSGQLFVHGDRESVKAVQAMVERLEAVTVGEREALKDRDGWHQHWTELNGMYNALHKAARNVAGYLGGDCDPMAQELYGTLVEALKLGGCIPKKPEIIGAPRSTPARPRHALDGRLVDPKSDPRWRFPVEHSPQEQLRMQLAGPPERVYMGEFPNGAASQGLVHTISGSYPADPPAYNPLKRPWDDEPVAATWAGKVALERGGLPTEEEADALACPNDEQFAAWKKEWEGFAPPTGPHVYPSPPPGRPECPTCERRVQEGEQQPFPVVQQRQWMNHGGRVWTRLCEACKVLADAGKLSRGDRGFP
jgi:hypothetical protein